MNGEPARTAGDILRRKIAAFHEERAITADPARRFELDELLARAHSDLAAWEAANESPGTPGARPPDQVGPAPAAVWPPPVDIRRVERYAGLFVGREDELAVLDRAWAASAPPPAADPAALDRAAGPAPAAAAVARPRVLSIVALGGEGKTALVARWLVAQQAAGWPGCDGVFAWSFYSQGTREHAAVSSDLFLAEALRFFGDPGMAASAASQWDKGRRLAQLLAGRRALLVLDGLEPLQRPPGPPHDGGLADGGIETLLRGLATTNGGLCLVTTRYRIPNLDAYGPAAETVDLTSLPKDTGAALAWRILRPSGAPGLAEQAELEAMVASVGGHALSVQLLASYLRYAFGGHLPSWRQVSLADADAAHGEHARHILDAYLAAFAATGEGRQDGQLLGLTGLFDRPVPSDCLDALLAEPPIEGLTSQLTDLELPGRNLALSRLEQARLITLDRHGPTMASMDAHPLVRSLLADRLRNGSPRAWRAGHERLYHHLGDTTIEGDQPTLDDLQPLYHAVTHGCHAGLHQDVFDTVYMARICRRNESYAVSKLGAIGADLAAVAAFFDIPFTRPNPTLNGATQGSLTNMAGYRLRALGRLTDALPLMQAGIDDAAAAGHHRIAGISAGNLSSLQITLGELSAAALSAANALTHAKNSNETFRQLVAHSQAGTVYYQQGQLHNAATHYTQAEALQAIENPDNPRLHSYRGFLYCEFLGHDTETAAWHQHLNPQQPLADLADHVNTITDITERSDHARTLAQQHRVLLDVGLDTLTNTRATLHGHFLRMTIPTLQDLETANSAVTTLRQANRADQLPRALLARAALRTLISDHINAIADLDEAWNLTQQGPMPLYEIDTLLHRTRLYGPLHLNGTHRYPWDDLQADLDRATELIQRHGYHRRDQELADVIAALRTS